MADVTDRPPEGPLPDLNELARRVMDLWQDHLSAMTADPEMAESLARLYAGVAQLAGSWLEAFSPATVAKAAHVQPGVSGVPTGAGERSAGATTASPSSPDRLADLGEFARRLAALEERLDRLERASERRREARPSSKRARKRPPAERKPSFRSR